MANIIRWNPYRDMMVMRNALDRLVDSDFFESPDWTTPRNWGLALDVSENADEFVVKASLPGVDPKDIEITYDKDVLTINGEVKEEKEEEDEGRRYYMRERRYGSFSRSISLPGTIKSINATYESGVLTLHLPKAEEAKAKRIQVKNVETKKSLKG